jgi:hypothetical protein
MLTPYDEFPVHQAPHPFSHIPSTDYGWDDGHFFGVFNPAQKVFLATGLRVNPNTDMIGGYALLNVGGTQTTVRFNRCWRRNFNLQIGPHRIDIVEPLRALRLQLGGNDSGLTFQLLWEAVSPPVLEDHHTAQNRGRRSTDQTRYTQAGKVTGWINLRGKRWEVEPEHWTGTRDHSWGLYADRAPLAPAPSLLPPRQDSGPKRALRIWTIFRTEPYSGFYHLHETADGIQTRMNDVFGTPFAGAISRGFEQEPLELRSGSHELEMVAGTSLLKRAQLHLEDRNGGRWRQVFEVSSPPWFPQTLGYHPGSWKDGGTFFTYHGSEELALEWDEFDFSVQPFVYTPYQVSGEAAHTTFGEGSRVSGSNLAQGVEYPTHLSTYAPDGSVHTGAAQLELFINGPYHPLNLT